MQLINLINLKAFRLNWNFYLQSNLIKILQEFTEQSKTEDIASFNYVPIYIGLKDYDKVFALLNKSYEEKYGLLLYLKVDPIFENLRNDPRYEELEEKIGL